ncbi:MAG: ABC transporter permease subunit [Proteobacteria bacterium]|nr:ABC transporter permease subunit [Pseudomonadota bacterium]
MATIDTSRFAAAAMPNEQRLGVASTRVLLVLGLLVLWEVYARLFGRAGMVAPPTDVIGALGPTVFGDPKVRSAVLLTFVELGVAFLMSVALGIALGLLVGIGEIGRRGLFPIVLFLYAIPQVVLLPLVVLIFGLGPAGKIAFGVSHGVFPIIVNTIAGMRNVSPLLVRGAESMGASRLQVIRYVVFPHMVATVFAGLRLAMTMTLLGVLLAELFVSTGGIGYFTQVYAETFNPAPLFALIATLALMAVAINELVRRVELRFTRWKQ